jgi:hypothetical protein
MKALIVYESMYGNTRTIAEATATGLRGAGWEAVVVQVAQADTKIPPDVDLLLVGGPTHVHGLSRAATRRQAGTAARAEGSTLNLEPNAEGRGVREWLGALEMATRPGYAAFDTRLSGPPLLTGRASGRIDGRLRAHGYQRASAPISFLVDKRNRLVPGEVERAQEWGRRLALRTGTSARV